MNSALLRPLALTLNSAGCKYWQQLTALGRGSLSWVGQVVVTISRRGRVPLFMLLLQRCCNRLEHCRDVCLGKGSCWFGLNAAAVGFLGRHRATLGNHLAMFLEMGAREEKTWALLYSHTGARGKRLRLRMREASPCTPYFVHTILQH